MKGCEFSKCEKNKALRIQKPSETKYPMRAASVRWIGYTQHHTDFNQHSHGSSGMADVYLKPKAHEVMLQKLVSTLR